MAHTQFEWTSADGIRFYGQAWEPEAPMRAVVALVHGLGEHSGRYAHVAEALNGAGYALAAFDLRGHGKSTGPRGHIPSYDALMDDIAQFLQQVAERFPGRPVFLYGHSLGGDLVLNYALRRRPPLAGVICTGPTLRLGFEPPPLKVFMGRVMNFIAPTFSQSNELDVTALSRDPLVVQAYTSDPLVHDRLSARLFAGLVESARWALAHAGEFPPLPLLLEHGSADRICSPSGSREFAAQVPGDCTLKVWDGLYHEIHNEPQKGEVLAYTIAWLNGHVPA